MFDYWHRGERKRERDFRRGRSQLSGRQASGTEHVAPLRAACKFSISFCLSFKLVALSGNNKEPMNDFGKAYMHFPPFFVDHCICGRLVGDATLFDVCPVWFGELTEGHGGWIRDLTWGMVSREGRG